ncbi:MAG: hypothetical protein KBC34_04380 [Phenylobacterium sp.]|nr:hypothetical protein [Phenylobacterium sp.]
MQKHTRPIFKRFPLDGHVTIAGEKLTTPYHVYDGAMLCLGGTVAGNMASALLAREHLFPVLDTRGRALAAIWVCDFTDANLGAHHELQISLFATSRPSQDLPAHPFVYFRALATLPDLQMVCHGLWNNTQRVVDYNVEHLRLDAAMTSSKIDRDGGAWAFGFRDSKGNLIAEGAVSPPAQLSLAQAWGLTRQMGLLGTLRLARAPAANIPVVNTRGPADSLNLVCQTYTTSERQHIRTAGPHDRIAIRHPLYERLEFEARFVQQLEGVGFIFLRPVPLT